MDTDAQVELDVIRRCVQTACRAPSIHNSQPWRWRYRPGEITLLPDSTRLLQTDPQGRQLVMSCGAVLHHLEVALRRAGITGSVERFPSRGTPAPIATVSLSPDHDVDAHDIALYNAISERRSDRRPFRASHIESSNPAILDDLPGVGVRGIILTAGSRESIATASAMSAAVHRYDSVYQHEIHWWAGHDRASDGIPRTLLGDEAATSAVAGRSFPIGTLQAEHTDADDADWVLLYSTDDSPESWLRSGEALSSVLLAATADGFATCTVTHVVSDAESRELLRHSLPPSTRVDACPQVLIRVGAAESTPLQSITARRSIDEVLEVSPERAPT